MSDIQSIMLSCIDEGVREQYLRACFSYLGSKDESLGKIISILPKRKTYVEVFGGSGRVLLARSESDLEIFNDRYAGVTCFYRVIKDENKLDQLLDKLRLTIHSREEFIWCKETWQNCEDEIERAYRWYYMMQNSFGGRGRYFGRIVNGKSNIYKKIHDNLVLFPEIHHRFKKVQVENLDWRQCFSDYDSEETVFYCDPPYIGKNYYDHNMTIEDHKELCERIFKLKGFVALSGYNNDIYPNYKWTSTHCWSVKDKITTLAENTPNMNNVVLDRKTNLQEYLWVKI